MKTNLTTVHICNHHGECIETAVLRINRKKFHPGVRFQAIRNKPSMPSVMLQFVRHTDEGDIIAKKLK